MKMKIILAFAALVITAGAYAQNDSTDRKMSPPDLQKTQRQNLQNNTPDLNNTQKQNLQNNPQDIKNNQNKNLQNNPQDSKNIRK
jgi:hypothetical protein